MLLLQTCGVTKYCTGLPLPQCQCNSAAAAAGCTLCLFSTRSAHPLPAAHPMQVRPSTQMCVGWKENLQAQGCSDRFPQAGRSESSTSNHARATPLLSGGNGCQVNGVLREKGDSQKDPCYEAQRAPSSRPPAPHPTQHPASWPTLQPKLHRVSCPGRLLAGQHSGPNLCHIACTHTTPCTCTPNLACACNTQRTSIHEATSHKNVLTAGKPASTCTNAPSRRKGMTGGSPTLPPAAVTQPAQTEATVLQPGRHITPSCRHFTNREGATCASCTSQPRSSCAVWAARAGASYSVLHSAMDPTTGMAPALRQLELLGTAPHGIGAGRKREWERTHSGWLRRWRLASLLRFGFCWALPLPLSTRHKATPQSRGVKHCKGYPGGRPQAGSRPLFGPVMAPRPGNRPGSVVCSTVLWVGLGCLHHMTGDRREDGCSTQMQPNLLTRHVCCSCWDGCG